MVRKLKEEYEEIEIDTEYITLGQFLKLTNIFDSGGMIKAFLQDKGVFVDNEIEHRRGRKLYPGDVVKLDDADVYIVVSNV